MYHWCGFWQADVRCICTQKQEDIPIFLSQTEVHCSGLHNNSINSFNKSIGLQMIWLLEVYVFVMLSELQISFISLEVKFDILSVMNFLRMLCLKIMLSMKICSATVAYIFGAAITSAYWPLCTMISVVESGPTQSAIITCKSPTTGIGSEEAFATFPGCFFWVQDTEDSTEFSTSLNIPCQ